MAILALFIIVVLQAQRVCRIKWFLYVAPLLVLFTLATGLSSSAVRGCLMALLVFLGPLLHRKPDLPSAMAMAAILILAIDPGQLADYGFLLSFGVVAGLIGFCPPLLQPVERGLMPDPWRIEPERPSVQVGRGLARAMALLLVSSLAAWLVSTPLIARWFNLVSLIALLANLIVIPVSTLVLLAGCLSILFGAWLPWLSEIFNFANVALVSFLLFITGIMSRIPFGHFFVASPPFWVLLAWFGTMLAWIMGWGRRRLWIAGPAIVALAWAVHLGLDWNRCYADISNTGEIPVVFVKAPGLTRILVHAGSRYSGRQVVRELQRQGVNRLAALVLPVADERHAGGAMDVMAAFKVHEIWCASTHARSPAFRQVLAQARAKKITLRVLKADDSGVLGARLQWHYQAASNQFAFRRSGTSLAVTWGKAVLGRESSESVTVQRIASSAPALAARIRCLAPGERAKETNSVDGVARINLYGNQSARVEMD